MKAVPKRLSANNTVLFHSVNFKVRNGLIPLSAWRGMNIRKRIKLKQLIYSQHRNLVETTYKRVEYPHKWYVV
jgi:hypothetical protein